MSTIEKPHLSASQLEMFCKCPEQWRRRYIENEIQPPGVAAIKGKTLHAAAEGNFRQKIISREDLSVEHFRELAVEAFDAQIAGDYQLTADEESRGKRVVLGEAKDAAVEMAEFHAREQAPDYQPVIVEERFRIELPGSHDLVGVIDLADELGRVTDFKTAGKKKSQADADGSVQLTAYHVGHVALRGAAPAELRLDTVVQTKKGISRDVVATTRSRADLNALANRLNVISASINAGIFPPAPPGSWQCFSMDTQMLSRSDGQRPKWSSFDEIKENTEILTFNPYSHLLEWQLPLVMFKKPWGKRMVSYDGRGIKFCVTPDHTMLIRSMGRGRWRTCEAAEIEGKGSVAYPVSAYLSRAGISLCDDQLRLSGWMTAEGHFFRQSAMIEISQSPNSAYRPEIELLLRRLGLRFTISPYANAVDRLRICAEDGAKIRQTIQADKSLPEWLWHLDGRQFRIWLAAFDKGDGTTLGKGSGPNKRLVQKCGTFIDELQALCVTHRMSAVKSSEQISSTGGRFFGLSVLDGVSERLPESASARKHFEPERVENEVWCVTVPNGFVMTRYRGRTLIAGNCSPKWCGYFRSCKFVNSERIAAAEAGE